MVRWPLYASLMLRCAQVAAAQTCEQAHKSHDEFESIYSADCARLATHDLRQALSSAYEHSLIAILN